MSNVIIRRVIVFSIWCMTISIGIIFFKSGVWNAIRHMTVKEIVVLHPEYFIYFVISCLVLRCLLVFTTNLWWRRD